MRKSCLLFLFAFSTNVYAQGLPNYIPTDSIKGWWALNDSSDFLGQHNLNLNNAIPSIDRFGNDSSCMNINNTYLELPWASFLDENTLTISFWIKNGNSNGNRCYFKKGIYSNSSNEDYYFGLTSSSRFHSGLKGDNSCSPGQGWVNDYSVGMFDNQSNWTHIIWSHAEDTIRVYRNDTLVLNEFNDEIHGNCSSAPLNFGSEWSGSQRFAGGLIDDIGIWTRKLTKLEIHRLYTACIDSIQSQPVSSSAYTIPGNTIFAVSHSDSMATYQWQQNDGTGWSNLSDFGIFSGTTTDSLEVTGVSTSMNGYGYRCLIESCSSDTTDIVFLNVIDNVEIEERDVKIKVYPNPNIGLIYIDTVEPFNYSIHALNGHLLKSGNSERNIDMHELQDGSYIIRFQFNKKKEYSHLITKVSR